MFFPTMIDLQNKEVLIVGGGKVGYRKAKVILEFGGLLSVVSPDFLHAFKIMEEEQKESGRLVLIEDIYHKDHILDKFMVIAATSSKLLNKEIINDCKEKSILVSSVDGEENSDFISPAIYKNGKLTISISTGGSFPYLSKKIRKDMERQYEKYNDEYLHILEEVRYTIIRKYPDKKSQIMDKILKLDIEGLKKFQEELNKNKESSYENNSGQ